MQMVLAGTRTLTFEMYSLDVPKLSDASPLKSNQILNNTFTIYFVL
jgi:hypothetical protein